MNRVIVCLLFMSACGGSSAPLTPTPVSLPPPPTPVPSFTGTVTATNGGTPLEGVTLTTGSASAITNNAGAFILSGALAGASAILSGPSIITRRTTLRESIDAFRADGFDLNFYRALARNGFEHPEALQPIRRWNQAPRIYLRTIDDGGKAVDALTLDSTAAAIINTTGLWTGGNFGIAGLERGTNTREGVSGWITVKWPAPPYEAGVCGRAPVGANPGWITLNRWNEPRSACTCNSSSSVSPSLVAHELGHALGYYHTGDSRDVMGKHVTFDEWCNAQPSAREQQYARYMYARPIGNQDPDLDPGSAVTITPSAIVLP